MELKTIVREDLWKAIEAHYERKDYTEAVRDTMFFVNEFLREKSGFEDKDGVSLVESSFLGNNPAICVNKNETSTEKNIQQGIGFAFKGLMQSVRNPISHEKIEYSQNDAEAIILYTNYLLQKVSAFTGKTHLDDIKELLYDEDFTSSKEYAELLLNEIPVKKRYDLLLELYRERAKLPEDKLNNFIIYLMNSISEVAQKDFIAILNADLLKCKNDADLRMYFHYFMDNTYNKLNKLAQLRIEDFVLKSICNGKINYYFDEYYGETKEANEEGSLATWINQKVALFNNQKQILDALYQKLNSSDYKEIDFVFEYFKDVVFNDNYIPDYRQAHIIKSKLKAGDTRYYNALLILMWDMEENKAWRELFYEDYLKCEEIVESE